MPSSQYIRLWRPAGRTTRICCYTCGTFQAGEVQLVRGTALLIAAIVFAAVLAEGAEPAEVVNKYCVTCHNDKARTGGLTLEHADFADVPRGAETWEKVIRKVRAGMMPPTGAARPEATQWHALVTFL